MAIQLIPTDVSAPSSALVTLASNPVVVTERITTFLLLTLASEPSAIAITAGTLLNGSLKVIFINELEPTWTLVKILGKPLTLVSTSVKSLMGINDKILLYSKI